MELHLFGSLCPGVYKLRVEAEGYLPEWFNDKRDFASADSLALLPHDLQGIDVDLAPMASISGRVTAGGKPRGYLRVEAYDAARALVRDEPTGPDGTYRVTGLPAGTYRVRLGVGLDGYSDEWYRDAWGFKTATPIVLAKSQAVAGIDADLVPAGGIAGRVTSGGVPAANVGVRAVNIEDNRIEDALDCRRRHLSDFRPGVGELPG